MTIEHGFHGILMFRKISEKVGIQTFSMFHYHSKQIMGNLNIDRHFQFSKISNIQRIRNEDTNW